MWQDVEYDQEIEPYPDSEPKLSVVISKSKYWDFTETDDWENFVVVYRILCSDPVVYVSIVQLS